MPAQRIGIILIALSVIVLAIETPISNGAAVVVVALVTLGAILVDNG